MAVKETAEVIGKECSVAVVLGSARIRIQATIADARESYGRTDYLVRLTPAAGQGEAWVSAERVYIP